MNLLSNNKVTYKKRGVNHYASSRVTVLFCSLAVLDPRVGLTMDVRGAFKKFCNSTMKNNWIVTNNTFSIYLCPLSFWLTLLRIVLSTYWCCPSRPCVHVFLACVHLALSLYYLFLQATLLFPHGVTIVYSLLWRCLTVSSLLQRWVTIDFNNTTNLTNGITWPAVLPVEQTAGIAFTQGSVSCRLHSAFWLTCLSVHSRTRTTLFKSVYILFMM